VNHDPVDLCADAAAQAFAGEWVEVFARRTTTVMTQWDDTVGTRDRFADGWLVGVRSAAGDRCGLASTNRLDRASLTAALDAARAARRVAPRTWHRIPSPPRTEKAQEPSAEEVAGHAQLHVLTKETRNRTAAESATAVTVGSTRRTVVRCDSAGSAAGYRQSEAQLHIRKAAAGFDAVQGARIRTRLSELPVQATVDEYDRCRRHLSAPTPAPRSVDWLLLSPLVTARIVSRMSTAALRVAGGLVSLRPGTELASESSAATLVDDGTTAGGPLGAPFDDEGTPRRRTVLIDKGVVRAALGCIEAGPSTGNASWTGWRSGIAVATTNCFLQPATDGAADTVPDWSALPGTGLLVEDIRRFRGGVVLSGARIEFELGGALVRCGEYLGSCRVTVSARPADFLDAFRHVHAGIEFYRIQGLFGGSWCLLDGSVAYGD
jgi:predicted Zn-dependent protease